MGSNVSFRLGGKRLSIPKEDKEKSLLTPGKASESSNSSTTTETKNDNGFFAHVDSTRTATATIVTETSLSKEAAAKKELPASESAHSAAKKELSASESAHSAAKKELSASESAHSVAKKELPASESAHAAATRNHSSSWASISAGGAGHTNGHQTDTAPGTSRNSSTDDIGSDIIYLLSQARKGNVEGKGHSDEHGHHSGKTAAERKQHQVAILKENLFMILSGLYGVVIVILGAVLPITEIFVKNEKERSFEAFYLYLYIVSIIFLVYVYAYLLRRNRLKTEFLTRTLSRSLSWTRNWAKSWAKADEATKGKLRKRMTSLDVDNHHTGTFYLRLGVLGFGIGSMIHSGLNFGKFFAVTEAACQEALDAVKPLFHLVFTFFQLYFIFMNSKMCIHRYKRLARFGLMHMCATNICVWFQSIVVETLHVIHMHHHNSQHSDHGSGGDHGGGHGDATSHPDDDHGHDDHLGPTASPHKILSTTIKVGRRLHAAVSSSSNHHDVNSSSSTCEMSGMMNDAVEAAGPYLYPCTIEYSLMCAGILYIMWKNVGNKPMRHHPSDSDDDDHERVHRMSVDCTSSSRGLFLGILMMVGTIISIIAFYMLVNSENMQLSGLILTHLSETFIYTVTLIAILLAAWRMKNLTFHNEHEIDLEDILVLISYTGLLVFIIFSLVASILHTPADTRSALTILSNIFMLLQSTAQTLFMLAGDRMTASDELQQRKKPGREFITFLLISNFAMWAVNTFETQTPQHNPIQVEFYGNDAWAIFTHVSVPLGIYYRFHSTVCFSNIWKNAWKIRKHGHGHG
ncbi:proton channel OtopLc-like isoform X2 [Biomphalaria glabrata]|uniref:Proton channel OtopLc-like isoform X2 n=1 Tax=Biomphalaria glabrata TaxID=6526 RepID=A0A9W2Z866_BIOGL|nr:proton channel OtopLc-like isoform X2 [Biomphalaria glabrata]XP_055871111.1 proton channel OtopLc-like isoform X2 [Biomphalaria glabrata]